MIEWISWQKLAQLTGAGFLVIVLLYMTFKFVKEMTENRKGPILNGTWSIIKEVKAVFDPEFKELRRNHDDMAKKLNTLATKEDVEKLHKELHARINHHERQYHKNPDRR